MRKIRSAACLLLLLLLVSGCEVKQFADLPLIGKFFSAEAPVATTSPVKVDEHKDEQAGDQGKINKFKNLAELKDFLARGAVANAGFGSMRALSAVDSAGLAAPMAAEKSAADNDAGAPADDYSKTNNQVEGVDEPDIIKTDGEYIYAVAGDQLFIVKAAPAETMEVLSRIDLKQAPQDIFLSGDRLIAFGADYNFTPLAGGGPTGETKSGQGVSSSAGAAKVAAPTAIGSRFMPIRRTAATFFRTYDLADKKNPRLARDLAFEGDYTDARLIGDYIYFITSQYVYGNDNFILPRIFEKGLPLTEENPSIYYFDLPYRSHNLVRVSAISVKDDASEPASESYLLENSQNIFVSEKNLYITYTKYLNEEQLVMGVAKELTLSRLPAEEQAKIAKIESSEDFVLSPDEKIYKVNGIIESFIRSLPQSDQEQAAKDLESAVKQRYQTMAKELEKTVIHKIAIDAGKLTYSGEGEVSGTVLNQFSMDEQGDYFRVATTRSQNWSQYSSEQDNQPYSNLFVLDKDLKTVGRLESMAKGERIYSARFMGNRAYLVTFKQTDPLFAIDLSEPASPKILGELKMPGFSSYLHPYDENTLIGLGHDTEENQWGGTVTTGLKLALFDVADTNAPKELASFQIGGRGSESEALTEHHSFLFAKDKNLLVVPASIREGGGNFDWGKFVFSGALVFDLAGKKINLRGKIDHSDGGQSGVSENWYGYNFYDNTVRRSLYIKDTLYTMSNKYLRANKLSDLAAVKTIRLENRPQVEPQPTPTPLPEPLPAPIGPTSTEAISAPAAGATGGLKR